MTIPRERVRFQVAKPYDGTELLDELRDAASRHSSVAAVGL